MPGLEYKFSAVGVREVQRGIRSIEQTYTRSQSKLGKTKNPLTPSKKDEQAVINGLANFGKVARQIDYKLHQERMRNIKREERAKITSEKAAARAAAQEHKRNLRRIAKEAEARKRAIRATSSRVVGSAGRGIRNAAATGAGLVGVSGGLALAQGVRDRLGAAQTATGIANRAAGIPGETRSSDELRDVLLEQAEHLELETGRSAADTLAGFDKFLEKTGNFDVGLQLLPQLTQLGDAMGMTADGMIDLQTASGIVQAGFEAMNVDPDKAAGMTTDVMRTAGVQSLVGQIGLDDLAKITPKLIAAASRMEGDLADNFSAIVGATNVSVATVSPDAAEASTAAVRFTDDVIGHQDKLKKDFGVDVFAESGNLKDIGTLMEEIAMATKGDLTKMTSIFGNRGIKIFEPFGTAFRNAKNAGMTDEDALESARKAQAKFNVEPMTEKQEKELAQAFRDSDLNKLKRAFADLSQTAGQELVPVLINDLLPAFKEALPQIKNLTKHFADFVSWFSSNPMKGLGAIVLASVARDIAAAGIGKGLTSLLGGMLPGVAGGVAGGAGASGGAAGTAALALAAGKGGGFFKGALGAKGLGAGAAAVIGTGLAIDQNESLKNETGGLGIFDILGGMISQGTMDPAEVVDKHMNEQAIAAAEQRAKEAEHLESKKAKEAELAEIQKQIAEETKAGHLEAANEWKAVANQLITAINEMRKVNQTRPVGNR